MKKSRQRWQDSWEIDGLAGLGRPGYLFAIVGDDIIMVHAKVLTKDEAGAYVHNQGFVPDGSYWISAVPRTPEQILYLRIVNDEPQVATPAELLKAVGGDQAVLLRIAGAVRFEASRSWDAWAAAKAPMAEA